MKQQKLTTEDYGRVIESFNSVINNIENEQVRNAVDDLFTNYGERFFAAPASTKLEFHNCFPGGLAEHTLRVYVILRDLAQRYGRDIPTDSLIVSALLHDFGKMGNETHDYYIPKDSQWHKEKLGIYYEVNKDMMYFEHEHLSLYMAHAHAVPLTKEEYQAILIHNGPYAASFEPYKFRACTLAELLHQADMLATKTEKEKWGALNG